MNANDYQRLAGRTLIDGPDATYTDHQFAVVLWAMELSIAAGQVADLIKKGVFHQHGVNRDALHEALVSALNAITALLSTGEAESALGYPSDNHIMLLWNALGIAGEAGEVVDLTYQTVMETTHTPAMAKELGDLLWYVAAMCTKLDLRLGDVMEGNITKLQQRYPNGYSSADSKVRVDLERR